MNKYNKITLLTIFTVLFCISLGSVSAADTGNNTNNTTGLANTPWPEYGANNNHTAQSNYTGPQTNTTKWNYTTGGNIYYGSPVIGTDGTIYIGSYDKKLYAIKPDGTLKWNYTTNNGIYGSAAIGSDGTIYFGSRDKNVYALIDNGTNPILKWNYTTECTFQDPSSPVIGSDGTIYIGGGTGSGTGYLYAFHPDGTLKWKYYTGAIAGTASIGRDGTIYVISGSGTSSSAGYLSALTDNGDNYTVKWTYTTPNQLRGSAIGADGTIYVGGYDNKLFAITDNGNNYTIKWNYTAGKAIFGSPAIGSDGTIYFGSFDKNFYALTDNGNNYTIKWTYTTGGKIYSSPAIGADGTIYFGSDDKKIYALTDNGNNYTIKWTYTTGSYVDSSPSIGSDGTLYIGSYDKKLYAIKDPAPVANFTADTTNGNTSQAVQFTDASTNPTAWLWDFGDSNTSTTENPTHTYNKAGTYTVKLTVTNNNGNDSNTITKTNYITITDTTPPTATTNLPSGTYNTNQTVTLNATDNTDPNPKIYYTTNGSDPTNSSTLYTNPITISTTTTLKYIAVDAAGNKSPIYTQTYTIDKKAPTATATLPSGIYNTNKSVELSMSENGTIYYTLNGSTPTTNSKKYTGAITINSTTTLKYIAVDAAGNKSPVYSETYTIDKKAPTATANVKSGLYNTNKTVKLSMSEKGTIYYTLNGSTPTTNSKKYTGPLTISTTTTLKYIAVDAAGNKSPIYTVKYTIDKKAPNVSSSSPKVSATGVSKTKVITIKFNEKVLKSVNWSKVYMKNLTTGKLVSINKWIKGNTLYIQMTKTRYPHNWYKIYIPKSAIKDNANNKLTSTYKLTFKT